MISVIVPVYNSEKYIGECLHSLALQTFKKFEIIIVDDGSTDNSGMICDRFAFNRQNVKVIHIGNSGLLLARHKGMMAASGDYFMSLDSDDCLRGDAIEAVEKCIDAFRSDIICFNLSRNSEVTYQGQILTPGLSEEGLYKEKDLDRVKLAVCAGLFNSMSGKAIKRDVVALKDDYSRYAGLMHGEDWLQLLRIMEKTESVYYLDDALYFYRENPASSTSTFKVSQINDLARVFAQLEQSASKWNKRCVMASEEAVCRHVQWLMFGIAKSNAPNDDKRKYADEAIGLIKEYCHGREIDDVIRSLRYDFRIPLWLATKKSPLVALKISNIIQYVSKMVQYIKR